MASPRARSLSGLHLPIAYGAISGLQVKGPRLLTCAVLAAACGAYHSGRTVVAGGHWFEVFTCRGVNQNEVRCRSGQRPHAFEGALVCSSDPAPPAEYPELCRRLPFGCAPPKKWPTETLPWQAALLDDLTSHGLSATRVRQGLHRLTGGTPKAHDPSVARGAAAREGSRLGLHEGVTQVSAVPCEAGDAGPPSCLLIELFELRPRVDVRDLSALILRAKGEGAELLLGFGGTGWKRCSEHDPNCGPVSLGGECLEEVGYDSRGRREAFLPRGVSRDSFTPGGAPCEYDGDCSADQSCESCDSRYGSQQRSLECRNTRSATQRFCGCVAGECTWFRQPDVPSARRSENR